MLYISSSFRFCINVDAAARPPFKHVENGQAVAEFLEQHPKIAYVNYPGLPSNKYYERAKKYLPNGGCGVVSFGLKGGRAAASTFMQ